MSFLVDKLLFFPPSPASYTIESYPGELCNLNGVVCLALPAPVPSAHILVYTHGNAADIGQCRKYLLKLRDILGMHVIAVEYPGYGISDGEPNENTLDDSLRRVCTFLHEHLNWPKNSIILVGRSIGTGPAVKIASEDLVGCVVLLAAFTSIKGIAEFLVGGLARVISSDRWKNLEQIVKVQCPILFIHGAADQVIPATHSIKLFRACTHDYKDIEIIDKLDHHAYNWKQIAKRLQFFFRNFQIYKSNVVYQHLNIPSACFEDWGNHKGATGSGAASTERETIDNSESTVQNKPYYMVPHMIPGSILSRRGGF